MKKFIIQAFIGIAIIFVMLAGMFLYFQPKAVHARSIKSNPLKETSISDIETITIPYEQAASMYPTNQALLLVNEAHPISKDYPSNVVEYKTSGVLMNECVIEDYSSLSSAITSKFNNSLYVSSSYRSYEDQVRVLEEEGPAIAAQPGTSEHQTGLAQDVYVMYFGGGAFIKSDEGQFVNSNCYDYGYIIRYPYAMQDYTGFAYEPWHIRYVGLPHSKIIEDNSIVFDDYAELYEPNKFYEYEDYIIGRMPLDAVTVPVNFDGEVTLSEDGLGYCFVTIRKAAK